MWVYGSSVASNWLTIFSLRKNLLIALLVTLIGGTLLFLMPFATPFYIFLVISAVIGTGMGATIVITTVSAQNSVPHKQLGVATSFNTLAKTLGQTMMIAVFGIIFNAATAKELTKLTIAVPEDAMNQLVNPHTAKLLPTESLQALRHVLYQGLHSIYGVAILLVIVAIVSALTLTQKTGTIRTNK
jgi:MFS family permease